MLTANGTPTAAGSNSFTLNTTPNCSFSRTAFDADAQDYITRVETADGAALEEGVKTAINNFVVGCKADGIWTAIKASCILAGARTLAGALVPLVGPAPTNFNFVSDDYNRKTGLVGNGSTKYLNTNFKISNKTTGADLHMGIEGSSGLNTGRVFGVFRHSAYTRHYIVADYRGPSTAGWGNPTSVPIVTSGYLVATRLATGSPVRYFNGAAETTLNTDSSTPSDWSVTAFVAHGSATGLSSESEQFTDFSSARLRFYHIGDGLTATQVANLSSRVTTLINAYNVAIL